jgi:hypothetical protein
MKGRVWNLFTATGVISIVAACTPAVSVQQPDAITKKGQEPSINVVSMANVGAVMFTEYNFSETTATRLVDAVNDTFGLGARVQAPAGTVLYAATVSGRQAYCTATAAYAEPLGGFSRPVCFFDTDQDGLLDEYWVTGTVEAASRKVPPVQYTQMQTTSNVGGGFRKDLLYQGIQADTLRISYREYVDDMARPAFQQDLTYNIEKGQPTTVVFQNVRMEVFAADNSGVRYRVLQGF